MPEGVVRRSRMREGDMAPGNATAWSLAVELYLSDLVILPESQSYLLEV